MPSLLLTPKTLRQLMSMPMRRSDWEQAAGAHLQVRIANEPVVTRRDAALDLLERFFSRVETVGQEFWAAWRLEEAVFAECDLGYRCAYGFKQSVPCAVVARLANAALIDFRLHCDPTPLPPPGPVA